MRELYWIDLLGNMEFPILLMSVLSFCLWLPFVLSYFIRDPDLVLIKDVGLKQVVILGLVTLTFFTIFVIIPSKEYRDVAKAQIYVEMKRNNI